MYTHHTPGRETNHIMPSIQITKFINLHCTLWSEAPADVLLALLLAEQSLLLHLPQHVYDVPLVVGVVPHPHQQPPVDVTVGHVLHKRVETKFIFVRFKRNGQ